MIVESLNEACKANSLLIDILCQSDSCKMVTVIRSGIEKWYLSRNILEQLPCPVVLIKHWAKVFLLNFFDVLLH